MTKNNNKPAHHELYHNELSTKTKKSMATRIISAIVLIAVVVPCVILGDWFYFGLMSIALFVACYEILGCAGKRTFLIYIIYALFVALIAYWPMFKGIVVSSAAYPRVDPYFNSIYLPIIITVAGFFLLFWLTVIYKDFSVVDASFLTTMALIIGFGFQCLFYLRYYPMNPNTITPAATQPLTYDLNNTVVASVLILFVFLSAVMTDTGAYFVGVLFGKTKMNERISPNKTWEGFFGGIVVSFLVCSAVGLALAFSGHPILYFFDKDHWFNVLILAFITPFFATLGDFVFSAIKRYWGIKDYGKLIPGHGGVLDRLDSIFFASIVASITVFIISNMTGAGYGNWELILVQFYENLTSWCFWLNRQSDY